MRRINLDEMAVDQLVERFTSLALDQDHALLGNEIAKVNGIYDQLKEIEAELKARAGDQRRVLLRLYKHPNAQVQLKAVKATLAVAPEEARQMLRQIASYRGYAQALEAGMSMLALERGTFKPV